ncbi:hypothetical protein ACJX0J_036817, partial [Zea mays]
GVVEDEQHNLTYLIYFIFIYSELKYTSSRRRYSSTAYRHGCRLRLEQSSEICTLYTIKIITSTIHM